MPLQNLSRSRSNRQTCSHKIVALEVLVFVTLFTMIGHMTINIWEKQVIHKKLSLMKENLSGLKKKIRHIGQAYDSLFQELEDLTKITESHSTKTLDKHPRHYSLDKDSTKFADKRRNVIIT